MFRGTGVHQIFLSTSGAAEDQKRNRRSRATAGGGEIFFETPPGWRLRRYFTSWSTPPW
jgi:hypothetical protein